MKEGAGCFAFFFFFFVAYILLYHCLFGLPLGVFGRLWSMGLAFPGHFLYYFLLVSASLRLFISLPGRHIEKIE